METAALGAVPLLLQGAQSTAAPAALHRLAANTLPSDRYRDSFLLAPITGMVGS